MPLLPRMSSGEIPGLPPIIKYFFLLCAQRPFMTWSWAFQKLLENTRYEKKLYFNCIFYELLGVLDICLNKRDQNREKLGSQTNRAPICWFSFKVPGSRWGWVRLKLGARNSTTYGRDPTTRVISTAFQGVHSLEGEIESGTPIWFVVPPFTLSSQCFILHSV